MAGYTKKQLVDAQHKYNKQVLANPDDFDKEMKDTKAYALAQINHLLSLVE